MKAFIKPIGYTIGLIATILIVLFIAHWAFEGLTNFID